MWIMFKWHEKDNEKSIVKPIIQTYTLGQRFRGNKKSCIMNVQLKGACMHWIGILSTGYSRGTNHGMNFIEGSRTFLLKCRWKVHSIPMLLCLMLWCINIVRSASVVCLTLWVLGQSIHQFCTTCSWTSPVVEVASVQSSWEYSDMEFDLCRDFR